MKKKGNRKSSLAELLETPLAMGMGKESPKSAMFSNSNSNKKKNNSVADPSVKTPSNISDLKGLASSRLDDVKRHIDRSHSEILNDLNSSHSRLHKRFKIQTQASQQMMDEAEKEYKKMAERISESQEAMKASYAEFMADAQASASRACKTSITELSQSCAKAIDGLRSRFGIPST